MLTRLPLRQASRAAAQPVDEVVVIDTVPGQHGAVAVEIDRLGEERSKLVSGGGQADPTEDPQDLGSGQCGHLARLPSPPYGGTRPTVAPSPPVAEHPSASVALAGRRCVLE